jgi:predicted phage terminase large subunit-like protein
MEAATMSNRAELFNAILRQNLYWFVVKVFQAVDGSQGFLANWHIEVMCDYLMMAARGEINRLIITLPPRHLKSICASVALPAWILGQNPSARVICISYSDELGLKHARDCRKVMGAAWYKRAFPGTRLSKKRSAVGDFETTRGGGRFTTSVGGALTGRGGGTLIVDDSIKPRDALSETIRKSTNQWFDNTLYSRMDNKNTGVIILVMQRTHLDDLVGHVREKEHWEEIRLPAVAEEDEAFTIWDGRDVGRKKGEALHPERESLEILEQTRSIMGSFAFEAQYQQNPVPEAGNLIKWDWYQFYVDLPPAMGQMDSIVQSWDPAISVKETADWSVCTTWVIRGKDYYLIDVFRERCDFPTLKHKIVEHKKCYAANTVLIEDAGAAKGMIQQLQAERVVRPIAIKPEGSKEDRMAAQSAVIESGRVFLPKNASWLGEFRLEMVAFPSGKHDDQVDSVSQFMNWAERPRGTMEMLHVRA